MRPSTNRLRSAPFQGANTGSSPVGCTICERGVMAATRRLERRAERRAGSSPVARTRYPLRLAWRRCRSHLSPGLTILSYQIIVCGFAAYAEVLEWQTRKSQKLLRKRVWVQVPSSVPKAHTAIFLLKNILSSLVEHLFEEQKERFDSVKIFFCALLKGRMHENFKGTS